MNYYRFKAFIFVFFSCFLMQTVLLAQSNTKITIKKRKILLQEALQQIEKQSTYLIAFNESKLEKMKRIDLDINAEPLDKALSVILAGTGFSYKIKDNYIMIVPKSKSVGEKKKVIGTVKDEKGEELIGVNVSVKGRSAGAITDMEGCFSLEAIKGEVLEFSYIGYMPKTITLGDVTVLDVVLQEDSKTLDEVVVTALGIKRSEKALSYNVQKVDNKELTSVKDINFVNSLSGKVAGVNINASSAGVGGATRVVMRGAKSITGGNNVLYVIDGVPMNNINGGDIGTDLRFAAQPRGESIADVNPEDIESLSVLTGPSAAALYGSSAANGVILINTKKGQEGKVKVGFSSSVDFSSPFVKPEFQNTYGNVKGSFESWGEKMNTPSSFDPMSFFQTGHNIMNSLTLTTGTKTNQTFVSVATTNSKGIIPNNKYDRYNFTVRNTASFCDDRLHFDVSGNYIIQKTQNMYRPGEYYNPIPAVYLFPRGEDWETVKLYKRYDPVRKFPVQNWAYGDNGMQMQNPYFIVNDMITPQHRKRYMFMASLKYDIWDWLNVTGRVRVDNTNTESENRYHASGQGMLYANTHGNGIYGHSQSLEQQAYMDLIFGVNKTFGDFILTGNLGTSMEDYYTSSVAFSGPILKVPNIFSSDALDPNFNHGSDSNFRKRSTAIFASTELGWRSTIYLTLTGRNDWSSLLVNAEEPSFFYPSVGLSGIISNMVKLPEAITFLKVRGSYTEVGSPIPDRYRGMTRGTVTFPMKNGLPSTKTIRPFYDFKAERTRSYELGLNLRMFDSKLNFDFTYYLSNTYNQTFLNSLPASSPYSHFIIQAGNIRNYGFEVALGYRNKFGTVDFSSNLTYSRNVNRVKELVHDYSTGEDGKTVSFKETTAGGGYIREGDAIGDVYVTKILKRDKSGNVEVDAEGKISTMELPNGQRLKIGSANPDFTMGWRNDVVYKNFSLSFLINARVGGIVTSNTQALMDQYGVSKASAEARDRGGVMVAGGKIVDAKEYYSVVGGQQLGAYYYYSATNVRLQELTLGYKFPKNMLGMKWPDISLSFIGRNLWMIYNKAPFDPELTATTGTYGQGSEYFGAPSLRNIGFSLKVQF
ncbi:SusC/RagA family TonB-linked outer membrane protein [Bacteroides helcogenes]|uniref:TonB-dependent receptor plug n=1 Tax=Bacteroides helcogenes (strain ATCC 35417 / DSM 20613 / JCM 6297 / CCUG 15421 / P 36-108) TaxID=693979 RepID=E6SPK3_BACT6|nr:SusC/RagA family TonB-linked outer membrane protein [Bacteroides helcogenes]ADV43844.1 TonB-dependent receptor plug [Bacteroides helcogenes P 36-108]